MWLLLLDPVPGAFDESAHPHVGTPDPLHRLHCTRRLIDAPVVRPCDETRRYVDGAAGKQLKLRHESAAGRAAIKLQSALKAGAREFTTVQTQFVVRKPAAGGDLGFG